MEYKISYPSMWDAEGYHYSQMIRVKVSEREAIRLNVLCGDRPLEKCDDNGILFTTHTLRNALADKIGCKTDKRFLDRNTAFKFEAK